MNISEIQKFIVDSLPKYPHGRLILSPRIGKSKIIIDLIKRDQPQSILWVTPYSDLAKYDIPNEFIKWNAMEFEDKLTTCTYSYLPKLKGNFSLVILDEDQFVTQKNLAPFFNKQITYKNIIGMTGTDTTNKTKHDLYLQLGLKVLAQYDINEAVDDEILSEYEINCIYVNLDRNKNILVKSKSHQFYTSEYKQYQYYNSKYEDAKFFGTRDLKHLAIQRMRCIYNSKTKLDAVKFISDTLSIINPNSKSLVFTPTIKQTESICKNYYHSKTNDSALIRFQNNEINTLGLVQTGGIGYTFPNLDNIIMMQVDSDGTGKSTQKICRALLKEKDKVAQIYLVYLKDTQDEEWLKSTLTSFDESKINYYSLHQFKQLCLEKKLNSESIQI